MNDGCRFALIISVFLCCFAGVLQAQSYVAYFNRGKEALLKDDYPDYRNYMAMADSLRPNHPVIMQHLARGYALNRDNEQALQTLEKLSGFYASESVLDSTAFEALLSLQGWEKLVNKIRSHRERKLGSKPAIEFRMPGFHPEGIAYDPAQNLFYLGDIRKGRILISDAAGRLKDFANLSDLGYWSAMGMALDPVQPGVLWVTTSAVKNFEGYSDELEGKSALLKLDRRTGKLLQAFEAAGRGHLFGDVTLDTAGKVYLTDSNEPGIYTLDEVSGRLVQKWKHPEWWNLQGIAVSHNRHRLYVSDYIRGVYMIDLATGGIEPLIGQNERLRGGDGIYLKNSRLIILQNGTTPKRVASIRLNEAGSGNPETLRFIDQARKDMEEPTLGTWVGKDLYFIGNSPWGYYDESGKPNLDHWPRLNIFRLEVFNSEK